MTVVRNTRKAGTLYGGRTAKPLDLERPEVRPFTLRKEGKMGRTGGKPKPERSWEGEIEERESLRGEKA